MLRINTLSNAVFLLKQLSDKRYTINEEYVNQKLLTC